MISPASAEISPELNATADALPKVFELALNRWTHARFAVGTNETTSEWLSPLMSATERLLLELHVGVHEVDVTPVVGSQSSIERAAEEFVTDWTVDKTTISSRLSLSKSPDS